MDVADISSTIDKRVFHVACQDCLRIASILSLESTDVESKTKGTVTTISEKLIFMGRFFYLVFVKGFTPVVFDTMPYFMWRVLSLSIYGFRIGILPFYLRLIGYGQYADWDNIGCMQPMFDSPESKVYKPSKGLWAETNLSAVDFGDPSYEIFASNLIGLSAHLSPHSQSPSNPFKTVGLPGNFFDHLTGVYKVLMAWGQPRFIVRGGLFHSVYGTFDYRMGIYDLRDGRQPLADLIGAGAEELAFAICTADRIGLLFKLVKVMYGEEGGRQVSSGSVPKNHSSAADTSAAVDGNPYPPLLCQLPEGGYPVTNHITGATHILPPAFFASFVLVMIADFMEQGAILFGSDSDECMFQFMRFRFYADLIQFVRPHLQILPPVWEKYMLPKKGVPSSAPTAAALFIEPTRFEVLEFKRMWLLAMDQFETYQSKGGVEGKETSEPFVLEGLADDDMTILKNMVRKYPYLAEPRIVLSAAMPASGKQSVLQADGSALGGFSRTALARDARALLEDWGMLAVKSGHKGKVYKLKNVIQLLNCLQ